MRHISILFQLEKFLQRVDLKFRICLQKLSRKREISNTLPIWKKSFNGLHLIQIKLLKKLIKK